MVEYAILLATTSFRGFAREIADWASGLNWNVLGYGLLALVALRIAYWAFRTSD